MFHILIAEDEKTERMVLAKTLKDSLGEELVLHEADNGKRAVDSFRQQPISLAILDIEMPVMNGIEAAKIIFSEAPSTAIIFLTAYDSFDYAKQAIKVRARDYILKPYSDEELLSAVDDALHTPYKSVKANLTGTDDVSPDQYQAVTMQMLNYLYTHYQDEISMQDAAYALNYSEPYFCKLFKQQTGQSFMSYLSEYRIDKAKELLAQPTVNIKDIGRKVGYPDANYFAKVFRRITGQSPSEYRGSIIK